MKLKTIFTVFLLLLLTCVSACSSKPTNQDFYKITIADLPNLLKGSFYGRLAHAELIQINEKLYKTSNEVRDTYYYIVPGNIIANDEEMYPYQGTVYLIIYNIENGWSAQKEVNDNTQAYANELMKKNNDELFSLCNQVCIGAQIQQCGTFPGKNNLNIGVYRTLYKWGKNSKQWNRESY